MDEEEEVKEGEEPTSLPDEDLDVGLGDDVLFTDDEGEYDPDNNYS
ncbi:hypothetical protein IT399_02385 [Candidatus Nomurabacteria bacterium]|nr:hypothetical protein [Candidatus Nomurabacteria bacterium]